MNETITEIRFDIPRISCGHCTGAIERELTDMEGVVSVAGDIAGKFVTVRFQPPATKDGLLALLTEIGYPAA
ncbi:MAG: heavy metal transporter [Desulfobacterales bacterium]|nr:MAG: heavy metal transporter [Desulfobacterales bacterium]